jgi:pyruvate dehydrogenase E2 component (dihydrolipoamide acetyltransferase)
VAHEFKLPEVGEGIDSGTVVAVLVAEGDRVEIDQPVLELETDKAVVEVPSTVSGVVTKVHVRANGEARVGQVVLTVDEAATGDEAAKGDAAAKGEAAAKGDAAAAADSPAGDEAETDSKAAEAPESDAASVDAPPADDGGTRRRTPPASRPTQPSPPAASERAGARSPGDGPHAPSASTAGRTLVPAAPSVRRLAREQGVDIAQVPGSGILGRISADDVMRVAAAGGAASPAVAQGAAAPTVAAPRLPDFSAWGETERKPMSGIRKATVRSMTTAWGTVPMVTHFDKADATQFEALRARHKATAEAAGVKLTPTAMLVKVVAAALKKFPDFNASLDVERQEIVYKRYVNVGVAVDTEHGLLVPVIKGADRKNMLELARTLGELAERARNRKLTPDDMAGGNFSVSNLGGIGGTGFTPIVNPPDVAILGVARSAHEPFWDADEGAFVPRLMMPLSLTYDHRLIDGASAARFLRWVCQAVEEPFLLALEG